MAEINKPPVTYEDWIDLGRVIIPCLKGTPIVPNYTDPNFKITKEEWKKNYTHCEIALRLDQDVDLDVDNALAKRFIPTYIKACDAVSGRKGNPVSHYWWSGKAEFKQYILPKDLENYYEDFPHGATICEIRHEAKRYTIVPESKHSKAQETVKWERYDGITPYQGNLKNDIGKIALSTALCITYASAGQRDAYCTAIAGVLLKHTDWIESEIDNFVFEIASASNDDEASKRSKKGTTSKKTQRNYGMPKLAEIIGCSTKTIATLFSWIGVKEATSEEAKQSIGEIIEYGSDRYFVKVNAVVQGESVEKDIVVDGPTLRNKKAFYDAVISKAGVWIPEMKNSDFEEIMIRKFEARSKSKDYVEEAREDTRFIKHFKNYISEQKAYTNKKELAYFGMPYFNQQKNTLEFNLDKFEDYLHRQKINLERVDLVIKVQRVLKAKKVHGKFDNKSCVSWKIKDQNVEQEDLIIDGEFKEITDETT